MPQGDLPALENVRAQVWTKWGKKRHYTSRILRNIESYYVDTSLDNDTDQFSLEIGDMYGDLQPLLNRDAEVRLRLFGVAVTARMMSYIFTGFADEISYDEQGTMRITGRDLSAAAVDSTVPPKQYKHIRAWKIVEQQARELKIGGRLNLHKGGIVKKAQYTDGSETYWEFWHRLYRKEKMWIWMGPDGSINANRLAYSAKPSYFFGTPNPKDSTHIRNLYLPVITAEYTKETRGRLGQIWVYGQRGDNGFRKIQDDPQTRDWLKRPRKIMMDTDSRTPKGAIRTAWEEIFETKVGAIEITLTVADPGFPIRQNRILRLRIPEMNLGGDWFVVGTRTQAGPSGAIVEVRLRQRQYAISRRVPSDPKLAKTPGPQATKSLSEFLGSVPHADAFVKAARAHHGPWNFELFLATLIAIGDQETAFKNIRALGGPGEDRVPWYKWESSHIVERRDPEDPTAGATVRKGKDRFGRTYAEWRNIFANEPGAAGATFAVGIMQLYSQSFKDYADNLMRAGFHDQFAGGRWDIKSNIMTGAYALRQKLKAMVGDSGRDADMWAGVSGYGHHYKGEDARTVPTRYAVSVKNKVFKDPGYLAQVRDALQSAREAVAARPDGDTDAEETDGDIPGGFPKNAAEALRMFNQATRTVDRGSTGRGPQE